MPQRRSNPAVNPGGEPVNHPSADLDKLKETMVAALEQGRPINLEPFSGTGNIMEWIEDYEATGKSSGWTEDLLATRLRSYLKGSAIVWYRAMDKVEPMISKTWTQLRKELVDTYKAVNYEMDLRGQLMTKRRPHADPVQFIYERSLICSQLQMSESETIKQIVLSIGEPYHSKLVCKEFRSITELRERLKRLRLADRSSKGPPTGEPDRPAVEASGPPRTSKTEKGATCWYCDRAGHLKKDCRTFKAAIAQQRQRERSAPPGPEPKRNPFKGVYNGPRLLDAAKPAIGPTNALNKVEFSEQYPAILEYIFINDVPVRAQVDCGASVTVLDLDFYRQYLHRPQDRVESAEINLRGAGDNRIDVVGAVIVLLRYQDHRGQEHVTELDVPLVRGLGSPVLLGRNFLKPASTLR